MSLVAACPVQSPWREGDADDIWTRRVAARPCRSPLGQERNQPVSSTPARPREWPRHRPYLAALFLAEQLIPGVEERRVEREHVTIIRGSVRTMSRLIPRSARCELGEGWPVDHRELAARRPRRSGPCGRPPSALAVPANGADLAGAVLTPGTREPPTRNQKRNAERPQVFARDHPA